jgi:hypothetical protein
LIKEDPKVSSRGVHVQSNEADGNRVFVFPRSEDGRLSEPVIVSSGGLGDGVPHLTSHGAAGYFAYFGTRAPSAYSSFDLGSWHLIAIAAMVGVDAAAGSAEEQWLRKDLAAHSNKCVLAYWHEPRWSAGSVHGNDSSSAAL